MTAIELDSDDLRRVSPAAQPGGLARRTATRALWLVAALGVLVAVMVLSVAVGSGNIPVSDVRHALFHNSGTESDIIVRGLRVPRTLLGVLAGIAFGLSGALIQAMTRNPLADPGVLGVNAGAGFAVVLGIRLFGLTGLWQYVWFSFAGAVVATVIVYVIGSAGTAGATPVRLTLVGIAFGAVVGGIGSGVTLLDPDTFDKMRTWTIGSLSGDPMSLVVSIAPFIAIGTILALVIARPLNAVALGDDLAASLGADITRTRVIGVIAVTLLCGAATAVAGPIGFVGLMVPHVARWLLGPDQRWIFAFTVIGSPAILLAADIIGRLVVRPGELQAGLVTAVVGAPVLIVLVRRRNASGL